MAANLPVSRIKTIMKSTCGVDLVSKESTIVATRAAELLVAQLAKKALAVAKNPDKLEYVDVATVVNTESKYKFLRQIVPYKITVAQYRKLMENISAEKGNESSEDEESIVDESSSVHSSDKSEKQPIGTKNRGISHCQNESSEESESDKQTTNNRHFSCYQNNGQEANECSNDDSENDEQTTTINQETSEDSNGKLESEEKTPNNQPTCASKEVLPNVTVDLTLTSESEGDSKSSSDSESDSVSDSKSEHNSNIIIID